VRLTILGSGSGLPTATRDTCCLLIESEVDPVLVDCGGGIVSKLARAGIELPLLRRVVLTHDHVDHLYGLPHLLHARAVHGGCGLLTVFAPAATLRTVKGMIELHGARGPRYPEIALREIPLEPGWIVDEDELLRVTATPVRHGRDTVGLRFDAAGTGIVHSSDTLPSEPLVELARGAAVLLHDCGGLHADRAEGFGQHHSSAREAGEVAARAVAGQLVLMHLGSDDPAWLRALEQEAAAAFGRPVHAARDGEVIIL
jgi:ribonuclease BN (tRNA processing enzyme)